MCKSLPFILCSILFSKSTHPLISIDFTTLASASTQLRKRFRSGRRSWWSPSARQRSSGPQRRAKNRLKLGFHVLVSFAFLWPVTPSSWSSCTSFWSELRRCKPAEVNKVKAWCWQAVFMSTKEFRWPCLWMFLNLCQDLQHIVLGWQSLSFVEHFELHVYTENHLSKIMNRV